MAQPHEFESVDQFVEKVKGDVTSNSTGPMVQAFRQAFYEVSQENPQGFGKDRASFSRALIQKLPQNISSTFTVKGLPSVSRPKQSLKQADDPGLLDRPLASLPEVTAPSPGQSKPEQFMHGAFQGAREGLNQLSSPKNLGLMGGMAMTHVVPPLGVAVDLAAGAYFTYEMAKSLVESIPEAKKAWDKGDWGSLGRIVGGDAVSALLAGKSGKHTAKTGAKVGRAGLKAAEMSSRGKAGVAEENPPQPKPLVGSDNRATERVGDPEFVSKARAASAEARQKAGKAPAQKPQAPVESMSREQIEREIGELQDRLSHMQTGTAADNAAAEAIESRIAELSKKHRGMLSPGLMPDQAVKTSPKGAPKQEAAPPPSPVREPVNAPKQRVADAVARSKEPQPDIPGLGRRVAPEEVGELPPRKSPTAHTVQPPADQSPMDMRPGVPKPAPPPESVRANDVGVGVNPKGEKYTAHGLPGVPEGATVVPLGLTLEGFGFMVEGPDGNFVTKTMPFNSTVESMVERGWLKKQRPYRDPYGRGGMPRRPAGPAEPPSPEGRTEQDPSKPSAPAGLLPPPGETPPAAPVSEPPAGEAPQKPTRTRRARRKAAGGAAPATEGAAPSEPPPSPKAAEPPNPTETPTVDPKPPASGTPGVVSNVGPVPDAFRSEIQNIIETTVRKEGSEPWEQVVIQPVAGDLRTPIGKPSILTGDAFTPENVWGILRDQKNGYKGAEGIRVYHSTGDMRRGSLTRRMPMQADTPPEPSTKPATDGPAPPPEPARTRRKKSNP